MLYVEEQEQKEVEDKMGEEGISGSREIAFV